MDGLTSYPVSPIDEKFIVMLCLVGENCLRFKEQRVFTRSTLASEYSPPVLDSGHVQQSPGSHHLRLVMVLVTDVDNL